MNRFITKKTVDFHDAIIKFNGTKINVSSLKDNTDILIDFFKKDDGYIDKYGKCTEKFKKTYMIIESIIISKLTNREKDKLSLFLASIGAKTNHLFQLPKESIPFWHLNLNNHFYKKMII